MTVLKSQRYYCILAVTRSKRLGDDKYQGWSVTSVRSIEWKMLTEWIGDSRSQQQDDSTLIRYFTSIAVHAYRGLDFWIDSNPHRA